MPLLQEYIEFRNGRKRPRESGSYPVYGGNGVLDYADEYNFEGGMVIGRVGAYCGSVYLPSGKYWVSDNAISAKAKKNMDLQFAYYLLKNLRLNERRIGTSQPLLTQEILNCIEVNVPEKETQKKIGRVLALFDKKILINEQINDNLQQQAQALFESWFINCEPWGGVEPSEWTNAPLGTYVEIKRGGSPRPIQEYLSDTGLRWLKISDVTSSSDPFVLETKEHIKETGLRKTVFLKAGELVLSNSATPGIPKILDVDSCIHDGWLYFPKSKLSKYYLYLFFKHIRKELIALGNGSVFTNLKTDILRAVPVTKADEQTLKRFDCLITPLFEAMLNADRENIKLASLRDALLPKLMSGEIDVSNIQL